MSTNTSLGCFYRKHLGIQSIFTLFTHSCQIEMAASEVRAPKAATEYT